MESSRVLDRAVFQRDAVYFAFPAKDNLIVGMGLFWGLVCGFAFGCGDLLTRLGLRNGTPFTGAIINSGASLIFFAVIVSAQGVQAGPLWPAMGWFLLTGAAAIGPGRLLFYYSIRRIGVSRASVLVIVTPLISMLTAVALLGERPSWRVVLGAVIIVGGLLSVVTDRGGIRIKENGYQAFDVTLVQKPSTLSKEFEDFLGGYRLEFKLIHSHIFEQLSGDIETLQKQAMSLTSGSESGFVWI